VTQGEPLRLVLQVAIVMLVAEGMEPSAAVNMVTLNAARHLRRDTDLGSIEVGKKADLVAFSPRDRFLL
jgi:alpha-D-ribose 1-methylphosphonate 5-triphosphate diphosphatase